MTTVVDGQLLRSKQDPSIYLIVAGRRRHIPDPATFELLRLNRRAVEEVEPAQVASVPLGTALPSLAARSPRSSELQAPAPGPERLKAPRAFGSAASLVGAFLAVTVVLVVLAFTLPDRLVPDAGFTPVQREQARSAVRGNILQVLTVTGVLFGYLLTLQSLQVSRATYHSTLENQLAERYAHSLELCDLSKGHEVRLGALLALGRIARSSELDRANIVRFFSVLLCESGLSTPTNARNGSEVVAMVSALGDLVTASLVSRLSLEGLALQDHRNLPLRLGDAAMDACSLRDVDARSSNLRDAAMPEAHLATVDLRFSSLERLMARAARFEDCDLSWSNLEGAVLIGAQLRGSSLVGSRVDGAILIGADLRGANLRSTDLRRTLLDDADLRGCKADSTTRFPTGLDPVVRGVVFGD